MIVTTDPSRTFGHVVLQKDHTSLAHQLARAFGNEDFARLEPQLLMEFVALNHDRGWDAVDAQMPRDPATGLPFSLDQTPVAKLLATTTESLSFNAQHHPYCGLLVGMHIWGLYHGRYGLTDQIIIDTLNGPDKIATEATLAELQQRFLAMKAQLASTVGTRAWVEDDQLMQNYKALQFFDRLSLYFNFRVGRDGEAVEFHHVPKDQRRDCSIQLTPLGARRYALAPYPFSTPELRLELASYRVEVATIKAGASQHEAPVPLPSAAKVEYLTLVPA